MRRRGLLGLLLAPLALRGTGGTPGEPAGYVPPSLPGVAAGSASAIIRARQVIVSGPGGGVYIYQPGTTPARGNPPIFWGGASPDPFGNVLPATGGVAGSGTFAAGNTRIIPAGIFTYSGTPAAGNLVASITPAAGTDSFGNNFLAGHASYGASFAVALNAAGFVAFYTGSLSGGWTAVSEVAGDAAGNLQVNAGGQLQLIGTSGVTIQGSANVGNPSPNSTSMNGLSSPGIVGTSGAASAGTAHTHSAGSYTVGSGQHVHDLQNHAHPL